MQVTNCAGRRAVRTGHDALIDAAVGSQGRFGPDPQGAFDDWPPFRAWAGSLADEHSAAGLVGSEVLGPPVPRPAQVFAIGLNYRAHAQGSRLAVPDAPPTFTTFPTCRTGPQTGSRCPLTRSTGKSSSWWRSAHGPSTWRPTTRGPTWPALWSAKTCPNAGCRPPGQLPSSLSRHQLQPLVLPQLSQT